VGQPNAAPEYEKREEPVTFRTSERKAAWLNDVARVRRIERSLLCDQVLTDWLENQERVRTPEYRTREIAEKLEIAKSAIDAAFRGIGMIPAGKQKRRTA
jgi:hypothetical protein